MTETETEAATFTISRYFCPDCSHPFGSRSGCEDHLWKNHVDTDGFPAMIQCRDCDAVFEDDETFRDHQQEAHTPSVVYGCRFCETSFADQSTIERHYWESHHDRDRFPLSTEDHEVSREKALECLYVINKQAKKYAELGTENYRKGKGATAKANSVKKGAMYSIKEKVLEQLLDYTSDISIHKIDGSEFYLFDFEIGWSFHTPCENMSIPDSEISGRDTLDDFEADSEKARSNRSLKECLLFFEDTFNLNANKHLEQEYISYGYQSHFIGWTYLGESETGDDSSQSELPQTSTNG